MSNQKAKQDRARAEGRVCSVTDCETGAIERGMCGYHYKQARAEERADEGKVCRIAGCERGWFARGLCRGHYTTEYQRERRTTARTASSPAPTD